MEEGEEKKRKKKQERQKKGWGMGFSQGQNCLAGCAIGHNC
jgi:hypothetical protein